MISKNAKDSRERYYYRILGSGQSAFAPAALYLMGIAQSAFRLKLKFMMPLTDIDCHLLPLTAIDCR